MRDPWKFIAFPIASVLSFLFSLGLSQRFSSYTGLPNLAGKIIIIAVAGLLVGFLVDEVIPVYLRQIRNRRSSGGDDFDGDLDDMDFE